MQLEGVQLAKSATYLDYSEHNVDIDTPHDHTFNGIMFDVHCSTELPVDYIEVRTVAVMGALGPMTVWSTPTTFAGKRQNQTVGLNSA